jgi:hypothetical protein
MRTILMVLMIVGLMSTVGVYAAGLGGSPTIKTLGGTGSTAVSAPTGSAVTVKWTSNASGQVTGADVTWTPATNSNYTIVVKAGSTTGSNTVTSSGTIEITTSVTLSATDASTISTAEVIITET